MTTATATATPTAGARPTATRITISTTPSIGSGTPFASRSTTRNPFVGVAARVIAGITGGLLGLTIGLVSAGFDTTRLLMAVGAAALGIGWLVALVTGPPVTSATRR